MKVGFTGTRKGMTDPQVLSLSNVFGRLKELKASEFYHGCCVGADSHAADMADSFGFRIIGHPSNIQSLTCQAAIRLCAFTAPPAPPLARNRAIVDFTDILIACPEGPETLRSGTWSTIRYARKLGRRIIIVWPNGTTTEENN